MNTSLAKKPASLMRERTQQVRDAVAAMDRAKDRYFATLARAQAQYFDDVKRLTDAMTEMTESTPPIAESQQSPQQEQPAV